MGRDDRLTKRIEIKEKLLRYYDPDMGSINLTQTDLCRGSEIFHKHAALGQINFVKLRCELQGTFPNMSPRDIEVMMNLISRLK